MLKICQSLSVRQQNFEINDETGEKNNHPWDMQVIDPHEVH